MENFEAAIVFVRDVADDGFDARDFVVEWFILFGKLVGCWVLKVDLATDCVIDDVFEVVIAIDSFSEFFPARATLSLSPSAAVSSTFSSASSGVSAASECWRRS